MKHCKVFIEPSAESKNKKKDMKTDNKVVYVEREQEREGAKKEVKKLMMRCFYHDPTRR